MAIGPGRPLVFGGWEELHTTDQRGNIVPEGIGRLNFFLLLEDFLGTSGISRSLC